METNADSKITLPKKKIAGYCFQLHFKVISLALLLLCQQSYSMVWSNKSSNRRAFSTRPDSRRRIKAKPDFYIWGRISRYVCVMTLFFDKREVCMQTRIFLGEKAETFYWNDRKHLYTNCLFSLVKNRKKCTDQVMWGKIKKFCNAMSYKLYYLHVLSLSQIFKIFLSSKSVSRAKNILSFQVKGISFEWPVKINERQTEQNNFAINVIQIECWCYHGNLSGAQCSDIELRT